MLGPVLIAVAVLAVWEAGKRAHVNRQGKIVSPHWPHDWTERIDDVVAKCTAEVANNPDVRRDITGVNPAGGPPSFEVTRTTHADSTVQWVRGCAAMNLYPGEEWPPKATDDAAKRLVWQKLGMVAARHLGVE